MLPFSAGSRVIREQAICLAKPVDSFPKSKLRPMPHSLSE
jgi:hypothetical protein